jgi:hypothetical protein
MPLPNASETVTKLASVMFVLDSHPMIYIATDENVPLPNHSTISSSKRLTMNTTTIAKSLLSSTSSTSGVATRRQTLVSDSL